MKAIVGFLIAIICAPLAAAEPADVPTQARALVARGRAAFSAGDYDAAILAFADAFALAPSPALLFDLAQAHRHVGHCEMAAALYRRYISGDPDVATLALAREHLAAMDRCSTSSQPVLVAAPRPHDEPIAIAAVAHNRKRDVGIGLGIGGGVALAASIYYAVEAHDTAGAVSNAYAHGGSGPAVKALDATGHREATLGKVFGATGVAAAGAGAILYYLGRQERNSITVVPDTHGAELQVRWQF